jgi:Ca-activated chloride channel family protein
MVVNNSMSRSGLVRTHRLPHLFIARKEFLAMQPPLIELIPGRPAVRVDAPTPLEVLVRITPPLHEIHVLRPPVNLGIVLDRSGSMIEGRKMEHAREATVFAIRHLVPTDRVSVTVFDDHVETIGPSALVTDKPGLIAKIKKIAPRGSTALHAGWAAGAQQVVEHVDWQGLNRVLLLSDGLANHGLTNPEAICGEVRGMAGQQVSTSTIGVGDNYNEDLMGAMARSGTGNYYFVENSVQLADIFQTELQGLMATTGRRAELSVRPEPGVELVEVMTELERGPGGHIKLPDMVSDMPISILLRISAAPQSHSAELCRFRLAWDPTGETPSDRQELEVSLALPAVSSAEWEKLPQDPAVQEQLALIMATRAREEYHAALSRNDLATAQKVLDLVREKMAGVPQTAEVLAEVANLEQTRQSLKFGNITGSRKLSHAHAYYRKSGRSSPKQKP